MLLSFLNCFVLLATLSSVVGWGGDELEVFDVVEEVNQNFYTLLGLSRDAEGTAIKKAFRKLSLVLHPDKNDSPDAEVQFRQLVSVYDILKDSNKRKLYDNVLDNGLPDWKHAMYYYRRVRKMGLREMAVILFVIITIGQYLYGWANYIEKKLTIAFKTAVTGEEFDMDYSDIIHRPRNSLTLSSESTTKTDDDTPVTPPNGSPSSVESIITPDHTIIEQNLFSQKEIRYDSTLFMSRLNLFQNSAESRPRTPERPITEPRTPERAITGPRTPERAITGPRTPERPITEPRTPERPMTEPRTPERPKTGPRTPERAITEPRTPERPKTEPRTPERPKTSPSYVNASYSVFQSSNDELPFEYVNPFTPDGKMIVNKVKAQRRRHNSSISQKTDNGIELENKLLKKLFIKNELSTKEESLANDVSSIKDESLIDYDYKLPMRSRLSEFHVSRLDEEFLILSEIGTGHHGFVYKCMNKMNGCLYAIKRNINPVRSSFQERIIRNEIYAHGAFDHPNIVRNYSCWKEGEFVYIQNEFCNGGSLESYAEKNAMTEPILRTLLLHIACALRYIHEKGLAHMDVKPANILISIENKKDRHLNDSYGGFSDDDTDGKVFKLADLGHICKLDETYDAEDGDCRYMPREVIQDNLKCIDRADIFSLGLSVFEVAGGGPLPKNGKKWQDIRNGEIQRLSNLSEEFNNILKALIQPEPEKRPSAAELVRILRCQTPDDECFGPHQSC